MNKKIVKPYPLITLKKEIKLAKTEVLLAKYSEFLEKYGYLDSDWREEEPTAIERFITETNKRREKWKKNIG